MTTISARDAKAHLALLLDEVAAGRTVTITRHGRPVARLVPATGPTEATDEVIDAIRAGRRGIRAGTAVRSMIEAGRR